MSDCYSYTAVIKNKLYFHSGLYIYFVPNIRILHSNMIQFHKYKIKSSASLPSQVCQQCPQQVNTSYDFKLWCESTDSILKTVPY